MDRTGEAVVQAGDLRPVGDRSHDGPVVQPIHRLGDDDERALVRDEDAADQRALWPAAHLAIHDRQQVLILNAAEAAATIPSLAFTP